MTTLLLLGILIAYLGASWWWRRRCDRQREEARTRLTLVRRLNARERESEAR